jgi:hypothetical protein
MACEDLWAIYAAKWDAARQAAETAARRALTYDNILREATQGLLEFATAPSPPGFERNASASSKGDSQTLTTLLGGILDALQRSQDAEDLAFKAKLLAAEADQAFDAWFACFMRPEPITDVVLPRPRRC